MPTLTNKRILITRTRHQASDLAAQLEALGASPILIPTIEIVPPASFAALDAALTCLRTYDWLVFTSPNAVELTVDLVPSQYIGESLAQALLPEAPGKSFLLVRAAEARDTIPEALTA